MNYMFWGAGYYFCLCVKLRIKKDLTLYQKKKKKSSIFEILS